MDAVLALAPRAERSRMASMPIRRGRFHDPALMDHRMILRRSANTPCARGHLGADFVERRGDEAELMRARPDARKDVVRSQNPAAWMITRVAIDRPDRQGSDLGFPGRVLGQHWSPLQHVGNPTQLTASVRRKSDTN